jgi:hypothetical protein
MKDDMMVAECLSGGDDVPRLPRTVANEKSPPASRTHSQQVPGTDRVVANVHELGMDQTRAAEEWPWLNLRWPYRIFKAARAGRFS